MRILSAHLIERYQSKPKEEYDRHGLRSANQAETTLSL